MSKKLKLQISHLETEVSRVTTLHTDLVATHGAFMSKYEALQKKLDVASSNEQTQKEEATALKLALATQENKFQDYQTSIQKEQQVMKEELLEAQQSALESAEAAESAAATATAAAAAAAAMAGSDDDSDDEDGTRIGDAMSNAEASREINVAEISVLKEHLDTLRQELKEETVKRKLAETRMRNLEDQQGLTTMSNQLRASEEASHKW